MLAFLEGCDIKQHCRKIAVRGRKVRLVPNSLPKLTDRLIEQSTPRQRVGQIKMGVGVARSVFQDDSILGFLVRIIAALTQQDAKLIARIRIFRFVQQRFAIIGDGFSRPSLGSQNPGHVTVINAIARLKLYCPIDKIERCLVVPRLKGRHPQEVNAVRMRRLNGQYPPIYHFRLLKTARAMVREAGLE